MIIENCSECGGTHIGSIKCPFLCPVCGGIGGCDHTEPEREQIWKAHGEARERCSKTHRDKWQPTNGFGWCGHHCPECGYSFFGEWD